eukprot:m.21913 g.21913  ORF g.21913 m.21913 type:complete len:709 (+) comp5745_c0_seq1:526-2652(+)
MQMCGTVGTRSPQRSWVWRHQRKHRRTVPWGVHVLGAALTVCASAPLRRATAQPAPIFSEESVLFSAPGAVYTPDGGCCNVVPTGISNASTELCEQVVFQRVVLGVADATGRLSATFTPSSTDSGSGFADGVLRAEILTQTHIAMTDVCARRSCRVSDDAFPQARDFVVECCPGRADCLSSTPGPAQSSSSSSTTATSTTTLTDVIPLGSLAPTQVSTTSTAPTAAPTQIPTTGQPTAAPTDFPTVSPTWSGAPTESPVLAPPTSTPTVSPTPVPSASFAEGSLSCGGPAGVGNTATRFTSLALVDAKGTPHETLNHVQVWLLNVSGSGEHYTFSTCNVAMASFDTILYLVRANLRVPNPEGGLALAEMVIQNDDNAGCGASGQLSSIGPVFLGSGQYYVVVGGYRNATGPYTVTTQCTFPGSVPAPPTHATTTVEPNTSVSDDDGSGDSMLTIIVLVVLLICVVVLAVVVSARIARKPRKSGHAHGLLAGTTVHTFDSAVQTGIDLDGGPTPTLDGAALLWDSFNDHPSPGGRSASSAAAGATVANTCTDEDDGKWNNTQNSPSTEAATHSMAPNLTPTPTRSDTSTPIVIVVSGSSDDDSNTTNMELLPFSQSNVAAVEEHERITYPLRHPTESGIGSEIAMDSDAPGYSDTALDSDAQSDVVGSLADPAQRQLAVELAHEASAGEGSHFVEIDTDQPLDASSADA